MKEKGSGGEQTQGSRVSGLAIFGSNASPAGSFEGKARLRFHKGTWKSIKGNLAGGCSHKTIEQQKYEIETGMKAGLDLLET